MALALLAVPAPGRDVVAQVPDTVSQDTAAPPLRPPPRGPAQDTLAQDTAAGDSLLPPPDLPRMVQAGPVGWAAGVWEWDRSALLRLPDLTLLQLLERIPGLTPVRPGIVGQSETAAVLGATAGAIRYVFDGFALDPLVAPTFDPSRIALLSLERVRVERRGTGATVHLETLTPSEPGPRSVVEAATGDLDINLFRGTFLAPRVAGGSLGLGFERLATGLNDANHLGAWLKWTFVRDSSGIQLELRQSDAERIDPGGTAFNGSRRDWALRARTRLGPLKAEAYAGASSTEDEVGAEVLKEGSPQGGFRLAAGPGRIPVEATAALRLRSHPRLPRQELEVAAWAAPASWLGFGGDVVQEWWDGPLITGRWSARARLGPVLGLSAFAGVDRAGPVLGDGALGLYVPALAGVPTLTVERESERAGVEARWGGLALGAAALRTRTSTASGFGLPFDSTAPRFEGGEAEGFEATIRLPTLWDPIRLEGWYVGLERPATWPYLPRHQWRGALVYHHLPLPSGNLELYARVEHVYRGAMAVPASGTEEEPGETLARVEAFRSTNAELVIRVLSVRAFLRWGNLMHRLGQTDLPGWPLPGQHVAYGVKWEFLN